MVKENTNNTGFSEQEREAMKTRAKELAAEQRAGKKKAEGEKNVIAAIAAMKESDRKIAGRIHELVMETAPDLWPKTWYGMPAYAKDDKVICFFQAADKFKTRYATLGFNDGAKLDEGNMWPTSFALVKLTPVEEKAIIGLISKAVE